MKAILDDAGVLLGYIEDDQATNHQTVHVPDGCDLEPGRYRWDGPAFVPIAPAPAAPPDSTRAIADGFKALRDQGIARLPATTLAWLAAMEG